MVLLEGLNVFQRAIVGCLLAAVVGLTTGDGELQAAPPAAGSNPVSPPRDDALSEYSQWPDAGEEGAWEPPLSSAPTIPAERTLVSRAFLGLSERLLPHVELGQPLHGTSWLNRPYYASAFSGTWLGDTLIAEQVSQETGFFSGVQLGTDLNHYWGGELRLSLFYINTEFSDGSRGTDSRNLLGDASLLYYPWGDSRVRPYGSIGLGFAGVHFSDPNGAPVDHTGLQLPLGLGVKYLWRNWLAWRLDIKDNITFSGNGVNTTNSWSFAGSLEVHFGGKSSTRYAPW